MPGGSPCSAECCSLRPPASPSPGPPGAVEVSISCGAVGLELNIARTAPTPGRKKTGNKVKVVSTPNAATERLALYQQLLAAGSSDIDVFQIDVIWPGILANHFIDLTALCQGRREGAFQGDRREQHGRRQARRHALVHRRRHALLPQGPAREAGGKPPDDLAGADDAAAKIQEAERKGGNDRIWGFVFQGKAYEGLTCDALEWVDSFGGGTIVDAEGHDHHQQSEGRRGARPWPPRWIGKIAPEGVLNYGEEEARGVFQSGNAVFMRNWPYAWALGQDADSPIKGKIGVVALPKGGADGKNTGTLGGWQLAVSQILQEPGSGRRPRAVPDLRGGAEAARDRGRATTPTIAALYKDPEVLEACRSSASSADLHQRRGAAVAGDRRQVQPGLRRVLQRRPRRSRASEGGRRARLARRRAEADQAFEVVSSPACRAARPAAGLPTGPQRARHPRRWRDGRSDARPRPGRRRHGDIRRHATQTERCGRSSGHAGAAHSELTRARLRSAWLFLAPMLVVLALVAGWPLCARSGSASPTPTSPTSRRPQFIGFDNYLANYDGEWAGLLATVGGARSGTRCCSPSSRSRSRPSSALVIALALNAHFQGRGLLRAAVLIPWAIPTVVSAQMWSWMFHDVFGIINDILHDARASSPSRSPGPPRRTPRCAAVIIVDVWKTTPFMALLILAGAADAAVRMLRGGQGRRRPPGPGVLQGDAAAAQAGAAGRDHLPRPRRLADLRPDLRHDRQQPATRCRCRSIARQQLVDFQDVGFGSAAATMLFVIIAMITVIALTVGRVRLAEDSARCEGALHGMTPRTASVFTESCDSSVTVACLQLSASGCWRSVSAAYGLSDSAVLGSALAAR